MQLWEGRTRVYRRRSGLSQEGLAELFGVTLRTVQRWEAGDSRPPLRIRNILTRNPVPPINAFSAQGLLALVATSPQHALLLNKDYRMIAISPALSAQYGMQFGKSLLGEDFKRYMPAMMRDAIEAAGGLTFIHDNGFATASSDFIREVGDAGATQRFAGRATQTALRIGREYYELSLSFPIRVEDAKPTFDIAYVDEIMQSD